MFVTVFPYPYLSPYFLHLLSAYIGQVGGAFENDYSRGREQNKEGKKAQDDKGFSQGHVTEIERREVSRSIEAVNQARF